MMFSHKQSQSKEKRVASGGTQTHTSCSPGKCPKHLDQQHYLTFLCLSSPLRAYWSDPRDFDLLHCHLPFLPKDIMVSLWSAMVSSVALSNPICPQTSLP